MKIPPVTKIEKISFVKEQAKNVNWSLIPWSFQSIPKPQDPEVGYNDKELDELSERHLDTVIRRSIDFQEYYQQQEEKERFYNQPDCNADFDYWAKHDFWNMQQGTALLLGKEPDKVNLKKLEEYPDAAITRQFTKIHDIAMKKFCHSQCLSRPDRFVKWALDFDLPVSQKLVDAISKYWREDKKELVINSGEQQLNTCFNVIGAFIEQLVNKTQKGKKQPIFETQSSIIELFEDQYGHIHGFSQRNLQRLFGLANKQLKSN
ncbi:hypothetical protein SDB03_14240 [Legionella pneumophila serogroup 1]